MDRRLLDYAPEIDAFIGAAPGFGSRSIVATADEMQDAAELLERVDEGELESYLVELIDRAGRKPGGRVTTALAAVLGRSARGLLRYRGSSRAAAAGRVLGLELEGLSPEDQAFEVARHFVRFASDAARRATRVTATGSPHADARRAAADAARTLAPGLLSSLESGGRTHGVWFRQGQQLVVVNP